MQGELQTRLRMPGHFVTGPASKRGLRAFWGRRAEVIMSEPGHRDGAESSEGAGEVSMPASATAPSQGPALPNEKQASGKKRASRTPIMNSLAELVWAVYAGKLKRLKLSRQETDAVECNAEFGVADHLQMLEAVSADRTLGRTRHLLLMLLGLQGSRVSGRLSAICKDALLKHTVFSSAEMVAVVTNTPEAMSDEAALLWLAN